MSGHDNACSTAHLGKLFHAHDVGQRIAALSAVLLGNGDAQKTVLCHLPDGFSGEFFCFIHLLSQRLYFFFGKVPEKGTCHFMFFSQRKIHDLHSSIYTLSEFRQHGPTASPLSVCCQKQQVRTTSKFCCTYRYAQHGITTISAVVVIPHHYKQPSAANAAGKTGIHGVIQAELTVNPHATGCSTLYESLGVYCAHTQTRRACRLWEAGLAHSRLAK